jgi:hypothetical protein
MEKSVLQRLFGFLRDLTDQRKADTPSGDDPGDKWRPRLTMIEGGKGKGKWDGNERRKSSAVIGIPYSSDAAENTVEEEEENIMKHIAKYMFGFAAVAAAGFALSACGGGGGGTSSAGGTAGTGTPVVASGTIEKLGSITVGGIKFEDTLANITADDTTKTAAFLQPGMAVKVKGTRNDDGVTGTATEIEVENEARGTITAKGADNFTVLGQTVFVDGGTVFANVANFAALAVNDAVEVHGSRDTTSAIRATRVEKLNANPLGDEFKGVVATKTGTTSGDFTLTGSASTFTYNASTVLPNGMFDVGDLVEVHLSGTTATRIERENVEDDSKFKPSQGQEFQVEGYVSGFTATPGTFQVGGQAVQTTSSTRYEGGLSSDLANDVKVEAEGHYQGTTLVADKIKFKDSVRFEANLEDPVSAGSVTVLGRTVFITSRTIQNPRDGSFVVGEGVKIRAFLNQDNTTFTATRIDEDSNPIASNDHVIQGLVITASSPTIVLVKGTGGFTVDTAGLSDVNFKDDNDASIGRTAFFGALKAGQTVVKAKGTYSSGTLTAREVEIE